MPQFNRTQIAKRIVNKSAKQEGILSYDVDNLYPQRMQDIVNATGTGKYCVGLYAKFINGKGFKDETFYKTIVNDKGLTVDKLLRKTTKDFANRNGFAIHFNYNANYQKISATPVFFKDCRLVDESDEDHAGMIVVYDDWNKQKRGTIKRKLFQYFDRFNPDPAIIDAQVEKAGGWDKWGGQILWFSEAGENEYPLAPYDAIIEDMETDGRVKNHKRKKSANGWNADFAIAVGRFEKDPDRQAFLDNLADYQGDETDGDIPLIEFDKEEQIPKVLEFPKASKDTDFVISNETSVQANIRKNFGFPAVLVGETIPGRFGLSTEMRDAYAVVNGLTESERILFSEIFKTIFTDWITPINPSNDYSILPVEYIGGDENKSIAIQLGAPNMQAIQTLMADTTLQPNQKINSLVIMFGLSFEQAQSMINGTPLPKEYIS